MAQDQEWLSTFRNWLGMNQPQGVQQQPTNGTPSPSTPKAQPHSPQALIQNGMAMMQGGTPQAAFSDTGGISQASSQAPLMATLRSVANG
jgi:hypothetical protein